MIEPLVPVDLVVDHSVQIDHYGSKNALDLNMKLEFKRNDERYQFMKWGMQAFDTLQGRAAGHRHRAPGEPRVPRARRARDSDGVYYPDTLVGTDSHTTMINGIGVVGWGVGGIEAEAGMLGQPVYFLTPDVVGVHLKGKLREGVTATDLVLTVTEMLRKAKVVGKFVEFFGEGAGVARRCPTARRSPTWRRSTARRWASSRSTSATLEYFRGTGRTEEQIDALRGLLQGAGHVRHAARRARSTTRRCSSSTSATVTPSLAGPKRPQDRIELGKVKSSSPSCSASRQRTASASRRQARKRIDAPCRHARSRRATPRTHAARLVEMMNNRPTPDRVDAATPKPVDIGNGDVLIAAITSCTNTSNPSVLLAAGLLAKKAVESGPDGASRTSRPRSRPARAWSPSTSTKAGLLPYLEKLGFNVAGYGCTTCIGNSGPLDADDRRGDRQERPGRAPRCCRATATSRRASIRTSRPTSSPRRRWWWPTRSPARVLTST